MLDPGHITSDAVSVNGANGEVVDRLPFSELPLFSKLSSWCDVRPAIPARAFRPGHGDLRHDWHGYMLRWCRRPTKGAIAGVPDRADPTGTDWAVLTVFTVPRRGVPAAARVRFVACWWQIAC